MPSISDYEQFTGRSVIEELKILSERLHGKRVVNVNSTATGGGVAEILHRMIPLLRELGVDVEWEVIKGGERFFAVTKKIHNALHGGQEVISSDDYDHYLDVNRHNIDELKLDADILFIHDPQPAALVESRKQVGGKWIWRCHVDFSMPRPDVWSFLKQYIEQYDASVFSAPSFARDLSIRQVLISPSIDPLSDKNRELPSEQVRNILERFGIDPERPILTQISRFD
ncbi:MAG: glycosyl transferase family 1, partial [Bacteroidota bacterium]